MNPLDGLLVLDFSQYLSGPSAALRLADLGARVIKIERTGRGDGCRNLSLGVRCDEDTLLFHTINRNKEGYVADLKDPGDLRKVKRLIEKADVVIENFRPGIMEKLGIDYNYARSINPKLIYGRITGYGNHGPWRTKPGQDLLIQSLSGIAYLNGDADQPPVPFGLAIADMLSGTHLVQGLLAALVRRGMTGKGALVEVSLMESILDLQFEVLTTYLNDGRKPPKRSAINGAHPYLGAPYGIYETQDGFVALAMGSIPQLGKLLNCKDLYQFKDSDTWITNRDEIKRVLADHLKTQTTTYWLDVLEPADIWCSDVLGWDRLVEHDGFKALNMTMDVTTHSGESIQTLRCPIRIDGQMFVSSRGAPNLGEHTNQIDEEFEISEAT